MNYARGGFRLLVAATGLILVYYYYGDRLASLSVAAQAPQSTQITPNEDGDGDPASDLSEIWSGMTERQRRRVAALVGGGSLVAAILLVVWIARGFRRQ